jgi:hypothetical protein
MEPTDESMNGMRAAHAVARVKGRKENLNPDEVNTHALKHFVTGGNPYNKQGAGLSQYLSSLDDEGTKQPRGMYAQAVNQSLDRPVISAQAAAKVLGHMPQADESGYITPRQFLQEKANAVGIQFLKDFEKTGRPATDSVKAMAANFAEKAAMQSDDVAGYLAGTLTTTSPDVLKAANQLRTLVASHSPNGPMAAQAHRTESEDAALRQQYGSNAEFMLTDNGRRNHDAQRVSDLWSAQDENYMPASGMAQVQRAVAPIFAYPYNAVTGNSNRLAGEPWDEFAMINRPDGKLEYATHHYNRASADEGKQGPVNVYTPEGRSKYGAYDLSGNPMGLVNATSEKQSFPMAFYRQNVGYPIMEAGTHIGNYQAGGDSNHLDNIRDLRQAYNRITPVMPDHMKADDFHRMGKAVNSATTALTGFNSATLGPQFADAYNATIGKVTGPMERTYLSDAANTAVEALGDMAADPINVAFNFAAPVAAGVRQGVVGAATSGAKKAATSSADHFISSLAKAPFRSVDDVAEETLFEGPAVNSVVSSLGDYFSPEKSNMLMGTDNPNSSGFDKRVERASTDARQEQMDAAQEYGRLMGKKPSPYRRTSASTNIPWLLSR